MIHVIASVELNDGQRDSFLNEFRKIMPKVHAETGCIEYGPTVDANANLAVPTPARSNVVTIIEKWESLDTLRAHLGADHMMEYRQRVKDYVKSVQLQVLEPV